LPIVKVPALVAKSLVEVAAFTVKLVEPVGVAVVVLIVNNAESELSPLAKRIVLVDESKQVLFPLPEQAAKEPLEKAAVAPVGKGGMTLKAASKAPLDPLPLPLATVIIYVALPAVP
jgi:hypothetical protein